MRARALVALGAVLLVLPAAGAYAAATGSASPAAPKACGRISLNSGGKTHAYSVRIDKGKVTCGRAKRVLRTFLVQSASLRGWFCVRGHASQHQAWAATCASPSGATVKAFPVKT